MQGPDAPTTLLKPPLIEKAPQDPMNKVENLIAQLLCLDTLKAQICKLDGNPMVTAARHHFRTQREDVAKCMYRAIKPMAAPGWAETHPEELMVPFILQDMAQYREQGHPSNLQYIQSRTSMMISVFKQSKLSPDDHQEAQARLLFLEMVAD